MTGDAAPEDAATPTGEPSHTVASEEAEPPSGLATWMTRPTPAYLKALVFGGTPKSRRANPNTPSDLSKHSPEELALVIDEGRRQLDRQTDSYQRAQDRAQTLITVTLVVLGFNTGVFSRMGRASGWAEQVAPWIWGTSFLLVVMGLLMAAAVVSVRGDFMAIDTTQVTGYGHPLERTLADDYADSVRLGAVTAADRVNAFQVATRYTVWGAALTALAFMLTT